MKRIEEIADIVELQTWAENKPTTFSGLKERLESALDVDDEPDPGQAAQRVMEEILRRQAILGRAYPFNTDGNKIALSHAEPNRTTYLFCLGLSLLPASEIHNEQRCLQFETVVLKAAQNFFGGEALRIGAPWRTAEIPDYATLLDAIIKLIPNLGAKQRTTAPAGGDAGWDVLIVKNFCDEDIPRLVALGNCATGKTDWKRKSMEAQPALFWDNFQHSDPRSVVVLFFAVPFTMDRDERLRKLGPSNLTMDRFRICENAPITPLQEIAEWIERQRSNALNLAIN